MQTPKAGTRDNGAGAGGHLRQQQPEKNRRNWASSGDVLKDVASGRWCAANRPLPRGEEWGLAAPAQRVGSGDGVTFFCM